MTARYSSLMPCINMHRLLSFFRGLLPAVADPKETHIVVVNEMGGFVFDSPAKDNLERKQTSIGEPDA